MRRGYVESFTETPGEYGTRFRVVLTDADPNFIDTPEERVRVWSWRQAHTYVEGLRRGYARAQQEDADGGDDHARGVREPTDPCSL
jgi:hypothetical protein